jgi:hypothetical protein
MTSPEHTSLESRLSQELEQEVRIAMTMTNTPQELERFQQSTAHRRHRGRLVAVAVAAVLCLIAGSVAAVSIKGSGSPKPIAPAHQIPTHKITAGLLGPSTPLPANVHVTRLDGPQFVGALAFGDLWATTGFNGVKTLPHATLYRISADGSRILSTATYPRLSGHQPDPVQVGNAIVVAVGSRGGYTVFSPTGQKIGTLSSTSPYGAVAGDPTGGWIATTRSEVAHIDVSGLKIDRRLPLPLKSITSLAVSPGALWVTDKTLDELVRINPSTGAITGRTHLAFPPMEVRYINGAVYVSTSNDYGVHRINPTTMALTATTVGSTQGIWPLPLPSYNGQVWLQSLGGTITKVNPVSLRTVLTTRVFKELTTQANGAVVGTNRIYVTDGEARQLYSYPTK